MDTYLGHNYKAYGKGKIEVVILSLPLPAVASTQEFLPEISRDIQKGTEDRGAGWRGDCLQRQGREAAVQTQWTLL